MERQATCGRRERVKNGELGDMKEVCRGDAGHEDGEDPRAEGTQVEKLAAR